MLTRLRDARHDQGITLVEILVAMTLVSIISAISLGSFRNWALASAHQGTAEQIVTQMKLAHERAMTEGVSYCVSFNEPAQTYTVSRFDCDAATETFNGPIRPHDSRISIVGAAFARPDGTRSPGVTFRPRGSAWPGTVRVTRPGTSKTYTITVEGFTGRVSVA